MIPPSSTHSEAALFWYPSCLAVTSGPTSPHEFRQFLLNAAELLVIGLLAFFLVLIVRRYALGNRSGDQLRRRVTRSDGKTFDIVAVAPSLRAFIWRYRFIEMKWTYQSVVKGRRDWLITVTRGVRVVRQEILPEGEAEERVIMIAREFTESDDRNHGEL